MTSNSKTAQTWPSMTSQQAAITLNRAGERGKKNFGLKEAAIEGRQKCKEPMEELVSHSWLSELFLSVGSSATLMSLSWAGDCGEVAPSQEGFLFQVQREGQRTHTVSISIILQRMVYFTVTHSALLQSKGGVQSEGLKSMINIKSKKIKPSSLPLCLLCRLRQIKCVCKRSQRQPCREKEFLTDRASSMSVKVSDTGVSV